MEGGERYFHVIINGHFNGMQKTIIFNENPDKIKFLTILNKFLRGNDGVEVGDGLRKNLGNSNGNNHVNNLRINLANNSKTSSVVLHAFVLMDTHAHFLFSVVDNGEKREYGQKIKSEVVTVDNSVMPELSMVLRKVLSGYAGWFNKKYKREGLLFAKPHTIIEKIFPQWQLDTLFYILINPVEAGIVTTPINYRFCSYKFHVGLTCSLKNIISVSNELVIKNFKSLAKFREALEAKMAYQNNMKSIKYNKKKSFYNDPL